MHIKYMKLKRNKKGITFVIHNENPYQSEKAH